jgi:HAD superfamily hydrolase (TIGR01459 family)
MKAAPVPAVRGLAEIADRFDAAIVDLWGVLHDGIAAYPHAIEALAALRHAGKAVCLLSNAPRRVGEVAAKLDRLGIGRTLYDHLLTSGEATWTALATRGDAAHAALGTRCFPISAASDAGIFDGLGLSLVDTPEAATFVLVTGAESEEATLAEFEPVLARCAAAGLPLVCANPDLVVTVGEKLCLCAGLLARHYETLGGRVLYHGKPHAPVYRECLMRLGEPEPARVLGIGDSLRTDVAGARGAGIGAVLIAGGIHREELGLAWGEAPSPAAVAALLADAAVRPDWVLPVFRW